MTVEAVERLIDSSRPRRGLLRGSRLVLLGMGMLLGGVAANPGLFAERGLHPWLVAQSVVIVLIAMAGWTALKQRRLARLMVEAFEAVQLRKWDQAREALSRLLRHPVKHPQARAESLLALASVAEADHAYEASQRIYESLLTEEQADPIQLHTTQVALAGAMLRTGQTADAVELVDRLARADLPAPLKAQVELLSLFREVTMGQATDHLDRAPQRRQLFRDHLSTRAGYGYGLLAAAFDRADRPAEARRYWHEATLLVPPEQLLERFEELAPVAAKYPAAELML